MRSLSQHDLRLKLKIFDKRVRQTILAVQKSFQKVLGNLLELLLKTMQAFRRPNLIYPVMGAAQTVHFVSGNPPHDCTGTTQTWNVQHVEKQKELPASYTHTFEPQPIPQSPEEAGTVRRNAHALRICPFIHIIHRFNGVYVIIVRNRIQKLYRKVSARVFIFFIVSISRSYILISLVKVFQLVRPKLFRDGIEKSNITAAIPGKSLSFLCKF